MPNIRRTYINGEQVELPVWNSKKVYALYYNGYCVWKNGMDYNFITEWIVNNKTLIFPSIETIGNDGFINWSDKIKDYEYNSSESYSHTFIEQKGIVNIECDIVEIIDNCFKENDNSVSKLTSIIIPETIKDIGISAFNYCKELKAVVINGENLTEIKTETFKDCSKLESITIPNTVTDLGYSAFQNCTLLNHFPNLNNLNSIGDLCFAFCTNLTSFDLPQTLTYLGEYSFAYCEKLLSGINIPNNITEIKDSTFYHCKSISNANLNNVETIQQEAFEGCNGLQFLNLGTKLKTIGYSAFGFCTNLQNFTFPDTIESIGILAFNACYDLTELEIPASIQDISQSAFENCANLKTIRIHKPVDSIPNAPWGAGEDDGSGTSDTVVIWD